MVYPTNIVMCNRIISNPSAIVNLVQSQDANDILAAAIKKHPSRFGGWALVPISDPAAAADELTRSVQELGLVGALLNNQDQGHFYDNKTYWPFFARAQELNVPVYLHPAFPAKDWAPRFQGNYPPAVAASLGISGWDWRKSILDLGLFYPRTSNGKMDSRSIDLTFHWPLTSRICLGSNALDLMMAR